MNILDQIDAAITDLCACGCGFQLEAEAKALWVSSDVLMTVLDPQVSVMYVRAFALLPPEVSRCLGQPAAS